MRLPSLALLIPTYNRADRLEATLRGIADDPGAHADGLTILVSENASPDGTAERVRALQAELPSLDLRLHRQPENLGAVGNIRWLVENAPEAEYLWLLGDDDVPAPGAAHIVRETLAARPLELLHLPHQFELDGRPTLVSPCPAELEVFPTGRELLLAYTHWLSFMSATVARAGALREAVRLLPIEHEWAPHIWFAVAGRGGECGVACHRLVRADARAGWHDRRVDLLTEEVVGAFDAGMRLVVDEADFGRTLDGRYADGGCHDAWEQAPLERLMDTVRRFPTSRELRGLLWKLALRRDRRDAIAVVDEASRAVGAWDDAAGLVRTGEQRFADGDPAGAARAFHAAIEHRPAWTTAWNDLGVALHAQGDPGAAGAFGVALQIAPDDTDALRNRSLVLLERGDALEAARDARRLLDLDPGDPDGAQVLAALAA